MFFADTPPAMISYAEEASEVVSVDDLGQIIQELMSLAPDVLVLFDVDSTLVVPDDAILRPAGEKLLDSLLGGDKVQNLPTGRRYVFREILLSAKNSLVDSQSVGLIRSLQDRGIPVAAFTAVPRGKVGKVESVADRRIEELKQLGFDFGLPFAGLALELPKSPDKDFSPIFKEGILFASLHPKGDTLKNFLRATGWQPKRVVLIDDQLEYVQVVGQTLQELGIPYTGYHYTGAAKLPCELNPEWAEFQVRTFIEKGEWIVDR